MERSEFLKLEELMDVKLLRYSAMLSGAGGNVVKHYEDRIAELRRELLNIPEIIDLT
jgi:hypothetical protein